MLLHDSTKGRSSLLFEHPLRVLAAHDAGGLERLFSDLEAAGRDGLWAAGFLAYEAGLAFEERLRPLLPERSRTPLAWFGLYQAPQHLDGAAVSAHLEARSAGEADVLELAPQLAFPAYAEAFARLMALIAAGDLYQANLTFPVSFRLAGDPVTLYRRLVDAQPVAFGALIETETSVVLSRSPELFVAHADGALSARPMKGTARRGRTTGEDDAARAALAADSKARAENLMIVDLIRNDLGRIAEVGSVRVTDLFSLETYRSLHQLTSGVSARLAPGVSPLSALCAMFPCGSVTGAPKIRAMEVIHALETAPRGLYTGAIGYLAPGGNFAFSVAIRTAVIDKADGAGRIGVGGGIVADSEVKDEYAEALLKLRFLSDPMPPLGLIETLLWQSGSGFFLLDRHLARLADSARYWGIPLDPGAAERALEEAAAGFAPSPMRVRLALDEAGAITVTSSLLGAPRTAPFRFMLAAEPMNSSNPLLFHKTTARGFYDRPRIEAAERFGVDEVVFCNERGELTEGSITSLFLQREGTLVTPALACGLLPGTLRAALLEGGQAREAVLAPRDLEVADAVFLGNSVRNLMPAEWVKP